MFVYPIPRNDRQLPVQSSTEDLGARRLDRAPTIDKSTFEVGPIGTATVVK